MQGGGGGGGQCVAKENRGTKYKRAMVQKVQQKVTLIMSCNFLQDPGWVNSTCKILYQSTAGGKTEGKKRCRRSNSSHDL